MVKPFWKYYRQIKSQRTGSDKLEEENFSYCWNSNIGNSRWTWNCLMIWWDDFNHFMKNFNKKLLEIVGYVWSCLGNLGNTIFSCPHFCSYVMEKDPECFSGKTLQLQQILQIKPTKVISKYRTLICLMSFWFCLLFTFCSQAK